jgi:hypothetical protein
MSTTLASAPGHPSADRSVRLMVLGGFQILLGLLCGLIAALMAALIFGGRMPQPPQGPPVDPRVMIPALVLYAPIAVAFIWLGVGLILSRRWAWTLTLVSSWMGLVIGLFAVASTAYFMGQKTWDAVAEQGKIPPEMEWIMRATALVMVVGLYVLLPGMFVVLLQPKSVRDTVYRRDPRPRWTDRCPMPVLAISLLLAMAAVSMLALGAYKWVLPIFGFFLSGVAGAVVICPIAVMLALLAWGNYRLNRLAWWGTLILAILGSSSSAVPIWRGDILLMYDKMGVPPEQVEMIRKMGMLATLTSIGPWMNIAIGAAWVGYLLYVRRYFVRKTEIANLTA